VLRIRHQLIIRHPSRAAVLLTNDAGRLRLPAFASEERHTADVDYINREVEERFRLRTTVLRSLRHSEARDDLAVRVHELETHGEDPNPPVGMRWCSLQDLPGATSGEDADDIAAWLAADAARGAPVVDGREWTLPGWFGCVRDWLEQALGEAGAGAVHKIVQQRTWASSCVLSVRAERGDFYLKAVPESARHEFGATVYLAQHFPGATATVVAVEPQRRWFLMEGVAGRKLEEIDDIAAWERAAAAYGRLQFASRTCVDDLDRLGCPTRGLDRLADEIEALVVDATGLRQGEPGGLSAAEADRLSRCGPELRRRCQRLATSGIPLTLEHGDLWPSNILVEGDACRIIDWEDIAIGHPFLGLAPFIVGLGLFQPALSSRATVERVERAYLAGFRSSGPIERLLEALRLASPLGFMDMAVRYRRQRPSIVQVHPWMRDLVPQTLRFALAQLDGEQVPAR
jgi:Ser/Thr protein kinase RdoA (MazF antagonist)